MSASATAPQSASSAKTSLAPLSNTNRFQQADVVNKKTTMQSLQNRLSQQVDMTSRHVEEHLNEDEDLSFGNTANPPQIVLDILDRVGTSFQVGDRIMHQPGTKFFCLVRENIDSDDVTKKKNDYFVYSLDPSEYALPTEEANSKEPVAMSIPVTETPTTAPEPTSPEAPVTISAPVPMDESVQVSSGMMADPFAPNTLGSIGVPPVESSILPADQPVVTPEPTSTVSVETSTLSAPVESVATTAPMEQEAVQEAPRPTQPAIEMAPNDPQQYVDMGVVGRLGFNLPSKDATVASRNEKLFGNTGGVAPARKIDFDPSKVVIPKTEIKPIIPKIPEVTIEKKVVRSKMFNPIFVKLKKEYALSKPAIEATVTVSAPAAPVAVESPLSATSRQHPETWFAATA